MKRAPWVLTLWLAGCVYQSSFDNADVSGSTLTLDPPRVVAAPGATSLAHVQVRTRKGVEISGVRVALRAIGCTITPAAATADAHGNASLTLSGCTLGATNVTASISRGKFSVALPVNASVTFLPFGGGQAATLSVSGPSTLMAGDSGVFTVTALDADGAVATRYTGSVALRSTDARAVLTAPQASTQGLADVGYIAGLAGSQQVTAYDVDDANVTSAPFSVSVTPGPAARLNLTALGTLRAGEPLPGLAVEALDSVGNRATDYVGVALVKSDDPQQPTLGVFALRAGLGQVDGSTLRVAGARVVSATDPREGLAGAVLNTTVAPGAARLAFAAHPSGGVAGAVWPVQPAVRVADAYDNSITSGQDSAVQVALTFAGRGTLRGTTTALAVSGVARWTDLSVNLAGSGGVVTARATLSSGLQTVQSQSFAVTLPAARTVNAPLDAAHATAYGLSPSVSLGAQAARLTPSNTDDYGNQYSGTGRGTAWDPNRSSLRMGSAGGCDARIDNCVGGLDATWTPHWAELVGYAPLELSAPFAPGAALPGTLPLTVVSDTMGGAVDPMAGQVRGGAYMADATSTLYLQLPPHVLNRPSATFMAWVVWYGGGDWQRIVDLGEDTGRYLSLTPRGSGGLPLLGIARGGNHYDVAASMAFPIGVWTHVAFTLDGATARLYINGVQDGAGSVPFAAAALDGNHNYLGHSQFGGDPKIFSGGLDEVAVWGTALTANEIGAIYERQQARFAGDYTSAVWSRGTSAPWTTLAWTTPQPFGKPVPSQNETAADYAATANPNLHAGLLLHWHLDETVLGTAPGNKDFTDASGNGWHGVRTGTTALNQPGRFNAGLAMHDDGGANTAATMMTPVDFTEAAWFNTTSSGGILGFASATSWDRVTYMDNQGRLWLGVFPGSSITIHTARSYNDGRWHQVVSTMAGGVATLYVDGAVAAGPLFTNGAQPPYSAYFLAGDPDLSGWPAVAHVYFRGRIDEVMLWSRGLSQAEVFQLWRRAANRVGLQLRGCQDAQCADNAPWQGPDGTGLTAFSELSNPLPGAPSVALAPLAAQLSWLNAPYAQYRAVLASDDTQALCDYGRGAAACSPELTQTQLTPVSYAPGSVTANTAADLFNLTQLSVTLGQAGCPGGVRLSLSVDGQTFYHLRAGVWQVADGTAAQSNDPAEWDAAALTAFAAQTGSAAVLWRAFLATNGAQACSVALVQIAGN